jgi:short-subunit dehydrogenase
MAIVGNIMSSSKRPVALVTGASSGIGADLARALGADGHDLILTARSEAPLAVLASELRDRHRAAVTILPADLSAAGAAADLHRRVLAAGLSVDVLINNAGLGSRGMFHEQDVAVIDAMIMVNMVALTELTRLFVPAMVASRRGRVLNVASTASFQPGPSMAVYCATKAYVRSFSAALSQEVARHGVTVTALCPGPTVTDFGRRAGVEGSAAFKPGLVMSSAAVAIAGYKALKAGKRVSIPGGSNRFGAAVSRFIPYGVMLPLIEKMMTPETA